MDEESYLPEFPPIQTSAMSDEFSRWQLWGEDLMDQLKHDLKGEILIYIMNSRGEEEEKWAVPKGNIPMMNDEGVNATISFIRMTGINKFAFLSNLDKETIYKNLSEIANELVFLYMENHKKYAIMTPIQASFVITKIFYFLEHALLMASEGGMRDYLKTTMREIRQYRDIPQEKKKGGGGMFGLFGKGGGNE